MDSRNIQRLTLLTLLQSGEDDKVAKVLSIFKACGVDQWARNLQETYVKKSFTHLENIAVLSKRKQPMQELAELLVGREF